MCPGGLLKVCALSEHPSNAKVPFLAVGAALLSLLCYVMLCVKVPPMPTESLSKKKYKSREQPQKLVVLSFGDGADALMVSLVEFAKVRACEGREAVIRFRV